MTHKKILKISGKVSDMFSATLTENHSHVGSYEGSVPHELGIGCGDYIKMEIDLETGHIIGWEKPSDAELDDIFKK